MLSSTNTALSDDCPLSTPDNEDQRPNHKSGEMEDGDLPNIPNPFCFSRMRLFDGLTYNGVPVQRIPVGFDHVERIKRIRNLAMRDDDIIIAAYRKCGTHWMSEILNMLIRGTLDYAKQEKSITMFEFMEDLSLLDNLASPRLLNSHFYFAHLPEQLVEKRVKLVHLIRNPKDCVVSLYHHLKQNAPQGFTFDNFLKGYTTEGYTAISHQPDYLRQMAQFEKTNPDHPIIHIHYEDLKKDPVPIIQELSTFIGVQRSLKFCEEVATACAFDKLKEADIQRSMPQHLHKTYQKGLSIYRKGMVGDWKNMFTVSQNEMFDQFLARQEEKGQPYTFRWS